MDLRFENDVKMYGIQTLWFVVRHLPRFENDVKMYGIQTCRHRIRALSGLRMM